jgi:hypothetical protein
VGSIGYYDCSSYRVYLISIYAASSAYHQKLWTYFNLDKIYHEYDKIICLLPRSLYSNSTPYTPYMWCLTACATQEELPRIKSHFRKAVSGPCLRTRSSPGQEVRYWLSLHHSFVSCGPGFWALINFLFHFYSPNAFTWPFKLATVNSPVQHDL